MRFRQYISLTEKSFTEKDVPKFYYLAINFGTYNEDRMNQTVRQLMNGELIGVKGISSASLKNMLKNWGNMREMLIVLPAKEFLQINKVSRVLYDNPDYLVQKGMYVLRRLFNDLGNRTNIFTKMQDYVLRKMKDSGNGNLAESIRYNGLINGFDHWVNDQGVIQYINTIKDIVTYFMKYLKYTEEHDFISTPVKATTKEQWYDYFKQGITLMGQLYKDEDEWVLKTDSLKIPPTSKLIIVEPERHKEHIKKSQSEDPIERFFANKENIKEYERWLEAVKTLKTKYSVKTVGEYYVNKTKYALHGIST